MDSWILSRRPLLGITKVEADTHYIDITGEVQRGRIAARSIWMRVGCRIHFSKLSGYEFHEHWWKWIIQSDGCFKPLFIGSGGTSLLHSLAHESNPTAPLTTPVYLVGFKLCVRWVHLCTLCCLVLNVFPGTLFGALQI